MVKWEGACFERRLQLQASLRNGDIVDVLDTWQDNSHPGSILSAAAFTKARPGCCVLKGIVPSISCGSDARNDNWTAGPHTYSKLHVITLVVVTLQLRAFDLPQPDQRAPPPRHPRRWCAPPSRGPPAGS